MKIYNTLLIILLVNTLAISQIENLRLESKAQRSELGSNGYAADIPSKNIGPTVFSGRISDIDVNPEDPSEFYAAYASGGLWHTTNNGTTFTPIFDQEAVMTIGDVAVDWPNRTIWLGTGEVNSSRSSYAGVGMYKSSDNGKTWTYHGLPESHHIGRIILHPTDKDVAWVAALGHLYTTNQERGVYKTTDGGQSWDHTLFVDDNSGAVDLIMDPTNSDVLYAATWDRIRHAWDFQESGTGSGIYKSIDGGITWTKVNKDNSGFPNHEGTGRIGLDIATKNGTTYIYAVLDNYKRRPKEASDKKDGLTKNSFAEMTKQAFALISDQDLQTYLSNKEFPEKYKVAKVKQMVKDDIIKPSALKEYVEDANSLLFDTPVIAAEVYVSTDDGTSWKKTHDYHLDGVYNSYGYYFGQIRVDPTDPMKVYIMGVPIIRSDNGGKDWTNISGDNVHADHHALWINPDKPEHIINGNDGGINISYDSGVTWIKCNSPSVGQFYYINVDDDQPYNVYGGTQDNGVWVGGNNYNEGVRWQMRGKYPYQSLMGGDGMQVQIDNRDNNTVYTGFQFGNYFRINKKSGDRTYITPKHELGDSPYRWNWQSPILLSPHNQDIFYMGSNKLLRSMDQGSSFTEISDDLTNGGKKGDVAYGTLATISESKFKFGLIYTGSDDGKVYRTKDGGNTWQDLGAGLPTDKWVSRIIASTHKESRVYLSLNGYRSDDFTPYVYMSDDYGDTWTEIGKSIPLEPVNVIKEDPTDENILYVGTDHGTYVSIDMGASFMVLGTDMPRTPVHDLVVQERNAHLLVGTHGRSIYKIDIAPLQDIENARSKGLYLYEIRASRHREGWGSKRRPYSEEFNPEKKMNIFSENSGTGKLMVYAGKDIIHESEIDIKKGLSSISYDLTVDLDRVKKYQKFLKKQNESKENIVIKKADNGKYFIQHGVYTIKVTLNGKETSQVFKVN